MVSPITPAIPTLPLLNASTVNTIWLNNKNKGAERAVPLKVTKSCTTSSPRNRVPKRAGRWSRSASIVPILALIRMKIEDKTRPMKVFLIDNSSNYEGNCLLDFRSRSLCLFVSFRRSVHVTYITLQNTADTHRGKNDGNWYTSWSRICIWHQRLLTTSFICGIRSLASFVQSKSDLRLYHE